jgi:hypothetical protein
MGGIQNIIKFSDCRDFYVFLLLQGKKVSYRH